VEGKDGPRGPSEPTDAALLGSARAGDARALELLLARHQAQVYSFGMKMCRDPEDAKDVLQDTLLAMARGVRDFRGASSISTWLYSIARSFCIKKRRRSVFAPAEERSLDGELAGEAAGLSDPAPAPDEALAGRRIQRLLEEAIGALDPMYREVLVLRDVEGLTGPEVAEVLGVSVEAVKSRLHRARLAVRAHVAPALGIPTSRGAAAAPDSCPDVVTMLSQHLEEELSADVCAEMERHVQACQRCRGACDSLKHTLALCRTARSDRVPPSVQDSVRVAIRDFLAGPPASSPR
jgi:RNA polymerase sigma-70 factor (ECF subfamily)